MQEQTCPLIVMRCIPSPTSPAPPQWNRTKYLAQHYWPPGPSLSVQSPVAPPHVAMCTKHQIVLSFGSLWKCSKALQFPSQIYLEYALSTNKIGGCTLIDINSNNAFALVGQWWLVQSVVFPIPLTRCCVDMALSSLNPVQVDCSFVWKVNKVCVFLGVARIKLSKEKFTVWSFIVGSLKILPALQLHDLGAYVQLQNFIDQEI